MLLFVLGKTRMDGIGIVFEFYIAPLSGVSRGVFWVFLNQGATPLLAPTLTSHLYLRRSETPLDTKSGYATASLSLYTRHVCVRTRVHACMSVCLKSCMYHEKVNAHALSSVLVIVPILVVPI